MVLSEDTLLFLGLSQPPVPQSWGGTKIWGHPRSRQHSAAPSSRSPRSTLFVPHSWGKRKKRRGDPPLCTPQWVTRVMQSLPVMRELCLVIPAEAGIQERDSGHGQIPLQPHLPAGASRESQELNDTLAPPPASFYTGVSLLVCRESPDKCQPAGGGLGLSQA
jgi:hypothetical protein